MHGQGQRSQPEEEGTTQSPDIDEKPAGSPGETLASDEAEMLVWVNLSQPVERFRISVTNFRGQKKSFKFGILEVKMYYMSLYVTPHWKQCNSQKVQKTLAQFWVDAKDAVTAARKAINYSEKHHWEVQSLKQIPTAIGAQDDTHGAIGLTHSHKAHEQGISMYLTDWEM